MLNHDQMIYEKIKELVLRLSYQYSESMTRTVAENITKRPDKMKYNLNCQLSLMVNDLLEELLI